MNIDTKTMTGNISSKAGATGLGSDMSFLDVGSLDDIATDGVVPTYDRNTGDQLFIEV